MLLSLILSVILANPAVNDSSLHTIFKELDRSIEERDTYQRHRENRIANLKREMNSEKQFDICNKLFEEYKYFQYDSAYVYARRLDELSSESNAVQEKAVAKSALLFCYKSVGFFNEAIDIIRSYDPDGVSDQELVKFYILSASTYQNLSSYVRGSQDLCDTYDDLKLKYYHKALEHTVPASYEEAWISLEIELVENYSDRLTVDGRESLLARFNTDEHEMAVQYSILSSAYQSIGKQDEALYYRALSAIYDIRSCTHETTSAKVLAEMMYERDEISKAYRYIQQALFDAQFYNSRLRMVEINAILPEIEQMRSSWYDNQILILSIFGTVVLVLLVITFVLLRKIKKKNAAIKKAQKSIISNSRMLKESNLSLIQLNDKLRETNEIKDQYIIQSLYGNTDFVNQIEKEALSAIRKIAVKQYDDASQILHNLHIKEEREKLYSSFDAAFLKLFPNFMTEFNKLFPAESQITLTDSGNLPMEVRIFALMRLGIDSTARVAEYLNLSVNTVYVYKTKLKARSKFDKDEFDRAVMAIPKP